MPKKTATILLAGFDAFDGEAVNPSWEVARALHGRKIAGHRVVAVSLPTVFGKSIAVLHAAIERCDPALVLCIGQAGGRSQLSLERVAINIDDARIPDNSGQQPIDEAIVADGPAAYFSSLPIKAMLLALRGAGIPVEVSQTAGTYVCNHVFYGLMHALGQRAGVRGGFLHMPYLPEQAAQHPGMPSLPLAVAIEAVKLGLEVAVHTDADLHHGAGALH